MLANKYYSKINNLLKQIPQTAMICNEKSKYKTKSLIKITNNLKNNINALYKKALLINKGYNNKTKKNASLMKNRKRKLNNFLNIFKNNVNNIPDKIYIVN